MYHLWIRACFDGVIVRFVFVKHESLVKGYVMPVARVPVPRSRYIPAGVFPDLYVFSMPSRSSAGIYVQVMTVMFHVGRIVPLCVPEMEG
jgi:hypothetical protein